MKECFGQFGNKENDCDGCESVLECSLKVETLTDGDLDLMLLNRIRQGKNYSKPFMTWYSKMYKYDGTGATVRR